jgi:Uma2 family endonuclease
MPVAIVESPIVAPPLSRKKFTRDEVETMLNAGLFGDQRFELIDGDIIDKMGQKPPHASGIQLCKDILTMIFGTARIRIQLPIEVALSDRSRNEPEPDVAVVQEAKAEYRKRHPTGEETELVVEIADSSLASDLSTKRRLYARAGVPEYWVVDLNNRRLVVHRGLDMAKGEYASVQSYAETESVEIGGQAVTILSLLP